MSRLYVGDYGDDWAVIYDEIKGEYIVLPYIDGARPFIVKRLDEIGAEIARRKERSNGKGNQNDAD